MIPVRRFTAQIIILLALFALFNLALRQLARHSIPRQLVARIASRPGFDTVAFGNSLVEAGFSEQDFDIERGRTGALNAGLGATAPVEHLILLHKVLERKPKLDVVVYGFFDLTPTVDTAPEMMGNRAMSYYVDPAVGAAYYTSTWLDSLAFRSAHWIPYLTDRGPVWERVELLRRRLAEVGIQNRMATNQFGRAADFSKLEASSGARFAQDCLATVQNHDPLSRPFTAFLALARAHSRRVVVVLMPMSPSHRTRFYRYPEWKAYREYVQSQIQATGSEFLEASDWVSDPASFADNLHLNPVGAAAFSRRLADSLYGAKK